VALSSLGGSAAARASQAHRCLVATGADDLPFGRNFNPFSQSLDFTSGGIYEPLVVVTAAGGGHQYNWLASGFAWSRDRKTLTITVRQGVRWTDGTPLTAEDVAYTLTAGRQAKVMDQIGLTRRGNEVASVRAIGTDEVAVRLKRVDTSFVSSVLANNVRVVPEHVFAHVKHVGAWSNPHPVGTGPFAIVARFGTQAYVLDRNPHYWQPGRPRVPCVERVVASSEESAVLQVDSGSVDLTDDFFPNAQQAYVDHDPRYFHYFYPANAPGIGLFFDDTRYPFSIVALRKAISLAIDRQQLSEFGEYGYAPPVDALGINQVWPTWITKDAAVESNWLATYNPGAARQMLLAAGFGYDGDKLVDPKGNPVVIHGAVVGTWVDYYADWRLIERDLRPIGIRVSVDLRPDFGAWWPDAVSTKRATLLWNYADDTTSPYTYFEEHLDDASFIPSGHSSEPTGNWEHFRDTEATRLLAAFRAAANVTTQHRIAGKLERIFLRTLPFVPLFAQPTWSTYSTRYFVGYPTARDDYVDPYFTDVAYVVALTRIRPRR
jgi:peptide/nickel transport system substrate-binding protein